MSKISCVCGRCEACARWNTLGDGGPALISCCKCGLPFRPLAWQTKSRDRRCLPCKRAQQNAANVEKGEALRIEAKAAYQRRRDYYLTYQKSPALRQKRAARRKVATEIEAGRLLREPCACCGSDKSEAHHDDYSRPLDVIWLCRKHHVERHAMLRARSTTTEAGDAPRAA